jgi:PAS domain S-box-containing protein
VLDSIVAHGIAVLDIDGRVLQWNAGAERTSGHRAADIVGRHVSLLYPAEAIAAGTPQRELDAARDGDGAAIEGERIRADGRRFWAEIALSPVRDAAGSLQGFALLMRDLSARRVAQRQHDEAALRLRAIVDTAVDGVITINERGVMESANRAAERLFGWRAAEMIGRNVSMLMPQPDRGAHDGYLRRYKVTGERRIIGIGREVLGQRRDGTTFPMELAVSETPLPDGRRIFTGLVRDVSDRKRIEAELLAADRRKDEFLAVLAHELRNPLAPIANALQVLKLAAGQPEHVNSLREVMERQTRQLVRLIDDLMDVSRITSGKLALRRGRVQLADIVATAVETSRSAIDAAGHRLVVDLPEAAVWLDVDPLRIAQVFSNLLANAARYTPPGGRLSLSARSDGARVQVEVSDNGIGIPAAGLARVFEMFAQVNEAQARAAGGLGIGLALVRSLVEMHGGSVTAHSAGPGCGASFVVTLPVAAPASAQDGDAQQTAALPGSLRVLVVDDNLDAADTLAMLLRIMNHHVELAHDGVDAIAVAARLRPALILMDISMPRMDGLEATRTIRAEPWGRQAFICTLTGLGQEQDRARSSAAGVDAHLVKPVAPDELQAILARARARHAGAAG